MPDKAESFSWLVRLGFAARGVTYALLGYLALSTRTKAEDGSEAAYDFIQDIPFGGVLMWAITIGLAAYVTFRVLCGISDIQNRGTSKMGLLKRVGDLASATAHTFLAYAAYQFASGYKRQSDPESSGQEVAGTILQNEIGWMLIGSIGLGFLVGAFMQAKNVWTAHFMHRISESAPSAVCPIGRVGHGARAIVFFIIGWSMVEGAWIVQEDRILGLGGAIRSLRESDTMYIATAIGLIMFGIFSLFTARYRIIPQVHRDKLKPEM